MFLQKKNITNKKNPEYIYHRFVQKIKRGLLLITIALCTKPLDSDNHMSETGKERFTGKGHSSMAMI